MHAHNPEVIPRNHLVEEALTAATERSDLAPVRDLITALKNPYAELPARHAYRAPPPEGAGPYQTFCGT
jgi:uncharacterized protein YdiU (UPF0061 family)